MKTLKDLLKSLGGKVPEGEHVYCVEAHGLKQYTIAKTPMQAAIGLCVIKRIKDKEIIAAAVEALGELAKEKA